MFHSASVSFPLSLPSPCGASVDSAKVVFKNLSIPYIDDCSRLVNLTEKDARAFAKMPGGGRVMGLFGCVDEQYDPSVECYTSKRCVN